MFTKLTFQHQEAEAEVPHHPAANNGGASAWGVDVRVWGLQGHGAAHPRLHQDPSRAAGDEFNTP